MVIGFVAVAAMLMRLVGTSRGNRQLKKLRNRLRSWAGMMPRKMRGL